MMRDDASSFSRTTSEGITLATPSNRTYCYVRPVAFLFIECQPDKAITSGSSAPASSHTASPWKGLCYSFMAELLGPCLEVSAPRLLSEDLNGGNLDMRRWRGRLNRGPEDASPRFLILLLLRLFSSLNQGLFHFYKCLCFRCIAQALRDHIAANLACIGGNF